MSAVDLILNLALLFLWIDWRAGALARKPHSVLSLANAVRPAGRRIASGYGSVGLLLLILLVRPCFYYSVGLKLAWTPELNFLAFTLPWRSDLLDLMYIYSTLTFFITIGLFYAAMLLLSVVNRSQTDAEVMQQFVRLQLGWTERIPWFVKIFLPMLITGLSWLAVAPLLTRIGLLPPLPPVRSLVGQAFAFGIAGLLAWKWLLVILFLLHLLNVYVYLGTHPVWPYISVTARTLLRPLNFLTFPKLDLSAVAGIALVFCVSDFVVKPIFLHLFQRFSG